MGVNTRLEISDKVLRGRIWLTCIIVTGMFASTTDAAFLKRSVCQIQERSTHLSSETARHSRDAMAPAERRPIEQFLGQGDDDPAVPEGFIGAATQALRGIEALTLPVDDLLGALKEGGLPCTLEELQRRFAGFVGLVLRGHDARNTRLTLDR